MLFSGPRFSIGQQPHLESVMVMQESLLWRDGACSSTFRTFRTNSSVFSCWLPPQCSMVMRFGCLAWDQQIGPSLRGFWFTLSHTPSGVRGWCSTSSFLQNLASASSSLGNHSHCPLLIALTKIDRSRRQTPSQGLCFFDHSSSWGLPLVLVLRDLTCPTIVYLHAKGVLMDPQTTLCYMTLLMVVYFYEL